MIYNILCIGGPLDGQRVNAADPESDHIFEYETTIYELKHLRNDTEIFYIYFHRGDDSIRSMLHRLIDGYRG